MGTKKILFHKITFFPLKFITTAVNTKNGFISNFNGLETEIQTQSIETNLFIYIFILVNFEHGQVDTNSYDEFKAKLEYDFRDKKTTPEIKLSLKNQNTDDNGVMYSNQAQSVQCK